MFRKHAGLTQSELAFLVGGLYGKNVSRLDVLRGRTQWTETNRHHGRRLTVCNEWDRAPNWVRSSKPLMILILERESRRLLRLGRWVVRPLRTTEWLH